MITPKRRISSFVSIVSKDNFMPKFEIWMPSDVVFMTAGLCLYQSPSRSHKYAIMQLMHFLKSHSQVFLTLTTIEHD